MLPSTTAYFPQVYICKKLNVYIHIYMCIYIYIYTYGLRHHVARHGGSVAGSNIRRFRRQTTFCRYIYIHMYVCMCVCILYIWLNIHIYIYIHMYISARHGRGATGSDVRSLRRPPAFRRAVCVCVYIYI